MYYNCDRDHSFRQRKDIYLHCRCAYVLREGIRCLPLLLCGLRRCARSRGRVGPQVRGKIQQFWNGFSLSQVIILRLNTTAALQCISRTSHGAAQLWLIAWLGRGWSPFFGGSDHKRFLWAEAWLDEAVSITAPEAGDIVVFDLGAGDQHVTLFENDPGNGYWECLGGNQSHQVKLSSFPKSAAIGIRRPSKQPRPRTPPPQQRSAKSRNSRTALLSSSNRKVETLMTLATVAGERHAG